MEGDQAYDRQHIVQLHTLPTARVPQLPAEGRELRDGL